MHYPGMRGIKCTIQRSGTSKGIFFLDNELPEDEKKRDSVILAAFGSPDKRQIDGLGGADPLTSKTAIVAVSDRNDADIEYTFGQVGIEQPTVFYHSLCGNITSGVGPFAINHGLIKANEGITVVRMYNRNTGSILIAEVPTHNGRAISEGDYSIAGVPGSGAKVTVNFSNTVGALAGRGLLPTGSPTDVLDVPGIGPIQVSIVDMAACQIYVRAEDLGLEGTETPAMIDSHRELLDKLESIRAYAAHVIGLADTPVSAKTERRNTPHIVIIAPAADYPDYLRGKTIRAEDVDILARMMFMQITHKTYAGTGSICTAVAAKIPGTLPNIAARKDISGPIVRIGHPAGCIQVEAVVDDTPEGLRVKRACIGRTVRTIMEGQVFVPNELFA